MPRENHSIICDSSSLISLTDTCFAHIFYFLKSKLKGKFLIPPSVENECIVEPMKMKMHAIHALRLKRAIKDGIIEIIDINTEERTNEIMEIANNLFFAGTTPIHLLHKGEAEMLALSEELQVQNILIDERTTRMLSEDTEMLRIHLSDELERTITIDEKNLSKFLSATKNMRFFRSSELLLLAYEKGYFAEYGELEMETLEAALYKLKYSGCAVGFAEIENYMEKQK